MIAHPIFAVLRVFDAIGAKALDRLGIHKNKPCVKCGRPTPEVRQSYDEPECLWCDTGRCPCCEGGQ